MLNRVTIMGRLCADPELRHTQNGIPVCSCRLAVERDYLTNGERVTDFFDVTAWRGAAEFISGYFGKGRMIAVEGRLQTRAWTDKSGSNRVSVEIVAESAYFADSKREGAQPESKGRRRTRTARAA